MYFVYIYIYVIINFCKEICLNKYVYKEVEKKNRTGPGFFNTFQDYLTEGLSGTDADESSLPGIKLEEYGTEEFELEPGSNDTPLP